MINNFKSTNTVLVLPMIFKKNKAAYGLKREIISLTYFCYSILCAEKHQDTEQVDMLDNFGMLLSIRPSASKQKQK